MNPTPTNDERLTWPTLPRSLDDATPGEWTAASRKFFEQQGRAKATTPHLPSNPRLVRGSLPVDPRAPKALDVQIGGDHYKKLKIQPMEYSMANKLDACQHTVVKYVTRFRDKGGLQDLHKAIHAIEMLIENDYGPEAAKR